MKRLSMILLSLLLVIGVQASGNGRFFKKFSGQQVAVANVSHQFASWFSLPEGTEWREVSRTTDITGMERIEYRQYVLGVEVEHSQVLIHARDGYVRSANGMVMEQSRTPALLRRHNKVFRGGTPTDMMGQQLYLVDTRDGYRYAYKVLSANRQEWVYYDAETQAVLKRVPLWHRSEPVGDQQVQVPGKTLYSGDVMLDVMQTPQGTTYLHDKARNIHTLNASRLPTFAELIEQGQLYKYYPQCNLPDDPLEATDEQKEEWMEAIEQLAENNELDHFADFIVDHTTYVSNSQGEYSAFKIKSITLNDLKVPDKDGNLVPFTPDEDGDDDDSSSFNDDSEAFDQPTDDDDDDEGDGGDGATGEIIFQVLYGADASHLTKGAIEDLNVDIDELPFTLPVSMADELIPREGATLVFVFVGKDSDEADTLAVVPVIPDASGQLTFSNKYISLSLDYEPWGDPTADIHWGMGKTLDFYQEVFGRDSYDGKGAPVYNLVYVTNDASDNLLSIPLANAAALAVQAPYPMVYGLGTISPFSPMRPVVELTVMAHEFTHIITGQTAQLEANGEAGALNESFSDIMGISVKKYVGDTDNWLIGEGVLLDDEGNPTTCMRDMANPKTGGFEPAPDTYGGDFWIDPADPMNSDNGGVHTNNSVQNKWFYLITDGGKGINDNGASYNIEGLGIEKSRQIAYLTLTSYATQQSDYAAIREASLEATEVLYGAGSAEQKTVARAWDAVGVGGSSEVTIDGIGQLTASDAPDATFYDLHGRALIGKPTQRGIYIVNGRKMVVR